MKYKKGDYVLVKNIDDSYAVIKLTGVFEQKLLKPGRAPKQYICEYNMGKTKRRTILSEGQIEKVLTKEEAMAYLI